jgi:hypothetical protein
MRSKFSSTISTGSRPQHRRARTRDAPIGRGNPPATLTAGSTTCAVNARLQVVSGSRVAVVAELAALDVAHVAQEHDARLEVVAVLHEVAAGVPRAVTSPSAVPPGVPPRWGGWPLACAGVRVFSRIETPKKGDARLEVVSGSRSRWRWSPSSTSMRTPRW